MACMMSDKSGPLLPPQFQQKRCSLPGPINTTTLNLYANHQQRRLSDRGLMVFKPNKPDIDLIAEFINPNKKLKPSAGSSGSMGSLLPTISSPSKSPCKSNASTSFPFSGLGGMGSSGSSRGSNEDGSTFGLSNESNAKKDVENNSGGTGRSFGCRKVRLRIQKNPRDKDNKVVGIQAIDSSGPTTTPLLSSGSQGDSEEENFLLCHPIFDARRFSDSAACRAPPEISISVDGDEEDMQSGIVCSTGDLLTLKCLTSSAQEIRYYRSQYGGNEMSPPPAQTFGNRSRSFDATYVGAGAGRPRKCAGSSWFNRRHLPISGKLPIPLKSPSAPTSPGPNQLQIKAPILTLTNETSGESEIIEVPSPPAVTPASSGNSPDGKQKVAWDKSGFVLDPAVLGFAIENHLRKADMGRRATVSTLYQNQNTIFESPVPTRARSASACVIPSPGSFPSESNLGSILFFGPGGNGSSGTGGGTSFGPKASSKSTSRRTSLQTTQRLPFSLTQGQQQETSSKEKRPSLSLSSAASIRLPDSGSNQGSRIRSHSYVETTDPRNGRTKTTIQSSFATNTGGSIKTDVRSTKTVAGPRHSSTSEAGRERKTNETNHTGGVSICTAIRDFIFQSLRS